MFFKVSKLSQLKKFEPSQRSTFPYWWNHWYAYNTLAIKLKCWKWKYLFHDFEKPWMKLFCKYSTVQKWHRAHNRHHVEYPNLNKVNWLDVMLDWECGQYTKNNSQRTCREQIEETKQTMPQLYNTIKEHLTPLCDKFNI